MPNIGGKESSEAFTKFYTLISSESDRGAVIITGSILDIILEKIISNHLLLPINKDDKLINGAYAPLGSFSAKIEMCYRLGFIQPQVLKQLEQFKKIRNDFAHRITEAKLDCEQNRSRIQSILSNTPDIEDAIFDSIKDHFENNYESDYVNSDPNINDAAVREEVHNIFRSGEFFRDNNNLFSAIGVRRTFDILFASMCMALERVSIDDVKRIQMVE